MNAHLINDHWLITFLCRSNLNNNTWVINNFFPDFWVKIFKNIDGIHYGKNAMIFVIWCDKMIMFIYNPFNIKLVHICFLEEVLLLFMLFITLGNMSVLPLTEIFYTINGNQRGLYGGFQPGLKVQLCIPSSCTWCTKLKFQPGIKISI